MTPDLFSAAWWSALSAIIVIDLVLAGDNAIVIGLAARNVPKAMQRQVILWGTVGAIAVRVLLTSVVVWLLRIPGFLLAGGAALIYVGWKLTQSGDGEESGIEAKSTMAGAIRTIVIADAVMGVDNVLAVGGAAHGSLMLVVIGLAISIPIVVWGSSLVLRWVVRFPQILWLGAGVLGWTAAKMIGSEPLAADLFAMHPWLRTGVYVLAVGGLVAFPVWRSLRPAYRERAAVLALLAAWLALWGAVEDRLGMNFDPIDSWRFADELVDLVRWLGWIPFALLLHRAMASADPRERENKADGR